MVIDRADNTVNICECKYYNEPYEITKAYALSLQNRKQNFIKYTGTKKNIFTTLIYKQQPIKNEYYDNVVDRIVLLEDLF